MDRYVRITDADTAPLFCQGASPLKMLASCFPSLCHIFWRMPLDKLMQQTCRKGRWVFDEEMATHDRQGYVRSPVNERSCCCREVWRKPPKPFQSPRASAAAGLTDPQAQDPYPLPSLHLGLLIITKRRQQPSTPPLLQALVS